MGSMVWTSDEARYLKAIFSWQDQFDDEQDGGNRVQTAAARAFVGDFRVLLIGAKGVGKTALLTRFCDGSFQDDAPPDPRFVRGGRRPLRIDNLMYSMDVLEMPSQHLVEEDPQATGAPNDSSSSKNNGNKGKLGRGSPSPTVTPAAMMLEQALAITEAAIVIYDVCNPASFQQARRLYDRLRQERGMGIHDAQQADKTKGGDDKTRPRTSKRAVPKKKSMRFRSYKKEQQQQQQQQQQKNEEESHHARSVSMGGARAQSKPARPFALLLVGTKSDADDSDRRVAWIDGSKAAAVPSPSASTAALPVPSIPPIPVPSAVSSAVPSAVPSVPGLQPHPHPHPPSASSPSFFLEASAKTGDNVTDVFVQIGREILRQRAERRRLMDEHEAAALTASASSSTTTANTNNTSLLRKRSHTSAMTTTTTRRTFGVMRVLGWTFGRRPVVVPEGQAVA
ncbi:uncharacterized protein SPSK_04276 [Sporothrix schenckii 1099-18]|uniref:Uncharacterized protein n=2 Tax=Sporothrix schenckii TaxID=29908 RepID=U7PVZ8_SPOS1|nr:uncharacterized protein SPSK_04276 [Sporothrix schenckii 1099-18]ERS99101.1 hypothetical protein HMPREF1624_04297 [Sporothrix schenckii ATCC 58251]KJR83238.1 hypothetical protein SPSK_04276 [Sporothrix schenckii 1099-18]